MGLSNFLGQQAGQAIGGKLGGAITQHYTPQGQQPGGSVAENLYNKVFGSDLQAPAATPSMTVGDLLPQILGQPAPDYSMFSMNTQPQQGNGLATLLKLFA